MRPRLRQYPLYYPGRPVSVLPRLKQTRTVNPYYLEGGKISWPYNIKEGPIEVSDGYVIWQGGNHPLLGPLFQESTWVGAHVQWFNERIAEYSIRVFVHGYSECPSSWIRLPDTPKSVSASSRGSSFLPLIREN